MVTSARAISRLRSRSRVKRLIHDGGEEDVLVFACRVVAHRALPIEHDLWEVFAETAARPAAERQAVLGAEGFDLGKLPAVEFGAVELERLVFGQRRGIEGFAVPLGAQVLVGRVRGEGLEMFARQCAADGDVDGGSVAHGRILSLGSDSTGEAPLPSA